jgi:hypothetical protein
MIEEPTIAFLVIGIEIRFLSKLLDKEVITLRIVNFKMKFSRIAKVRIRTMTSDGDVRLFGGK